MMDVKGGNVDAYFTANTVKKLGLKKGVVVDILVHYIIIIKITNYRQQIYKNKILFIHLQFYLHMYRLHGILYKRMVVTQYFTLQI